MKNNLINLSKTKIILICHNVKYEYYLNILENYKEKIIKYTWRRNNIYIEFDYNNKIKLEDDNNKDKYIDCIITCIKDILDNLKYKFFINLRINNSLLKNFKFIQKIVNLDYFSYIYFEKNFISNKINFRGLKNCIKVIYKNSYYENSCNLPEVLESVVLHNNTNNNIIFYIPNELKKILIKGYKVENLIAELINIKLKKLVIINSEINIKNTPNFLHDYDFLIINKYISSNNKYIDFNNLPYTLKILHLQDKITLSMQLLPNSIEQLKIKYFDKNLLENLPCMLKKIQLDYVINDYSHLFSFLPNSLEEIIINNITIQDHSKIINFKLPSRLKRLYFQSQLINFDFILLKYLTENNIKYTISNKPYNLLKKIEFL